MIARCRSLPVARVLDSRCDAPRLLRLQASVDLCRLPARDARKVLLMIHYIVVLMIVYYPDEDDKKDKKKEKEKDKKEADVTISAPVNFRHVTHYESTDAPALIQQAESRKKLKDKDKIGDGPLAVSIGGPSGFRHVGSWQDQFEKDKKPPSAPAVAAVPKAESMDDVSSVSDRRDTLEKRALHPYPIMSVEVRYLPLVVHEDSSDLIRSTMMLQINRVRQAERSAPTWSHLPLIGRIHSIPRLLLVTRNSLHDLILKKAHDEMMNCSRCTIRVASKSQYFYFFFFLFRV